MKKEETWRDHLVVGGLHYLLNCGQRFVPVPVFVPSIQRESVEEANGLQQ